MINVTVSLRKLDEWVIQDRLAFLSEKAHRHKLVVFFQLLHFCCMF